MITGCVRIGLVAALLAGVLVGRAEARKVVWTVGAEEVVVSNSAEHAYVLRFWLPAGLEGVRIDHAVVEFYVDAEDNESTEPFHVRMVPVENISAELASYEVIEGSAVDFTGTGTGQGERVRMDATGAIRHWAASGGVAYAGIEGAGVAERSAALATEGLGEGAVARFTAWTSRR